MSCMSGVGSLGGSRAPWVDRLAPKATIGLGVELFAIASAACLDRLDPLDPEAMVER
jgi:hypothetical protein